MISIAFGLLGILIGLAMLLLPLVRRLRATDRSCDDSPMVTTRLACVTVAATRWVSWQTASIESVNASKSSSLRSAISTPA